MVIERGEKRKKCNMVKKIIKIGKEINKKIYLIGRKGKKGRWKERLRR